MYNNNSENIQNDHSILEEKINTRNTLKSLNRNTNLLNQYENNVKNIQNEINKLEQLIGNLERQTNLWTKCIL